MNGFGYGSDVVLNHINLLTSFIKLILFILLLSQQLGNPPRNTIVDEPLRLAIKNGHLECAEILLKHGADPNARYFLGSEINLISPLNVLCLEMLLKFGAFPDARDRSGLTPLMKACRHPQGYAAAKILIHYGADVNAITSGKFFYQLRARS